MDRCWEHLRAAGAQLSRLTGDTACSLAGMRDEVEEAARGLELPQTAEAEAAAAGWHGAAVGGGVAV